MRHRFSVAAVFAVALLASACTTSGRGYFRPDLNDDIVARISPGQSQPEVTALLGIPHRKLRFDNLKSTAWDYIYKDSWGYWVAFSVMMGDDGRVVNKVSRRIEPSDHD